MEIIRKEENGVEFYSIAITGQSGMSQSGLATLAGVSRQSLIKLEETLVTRAPSEALKPFVGKDITLVTENPTIDGRLVGNLKIYRSSFCAAVLRHYSSKEEEEKLPDRPATYSLVKFAELGIDRWIQGITGWTEYQGSIRLHTNIYVSRIENMRDHAIDDDHWMIFREAAELLLLIEKDWKVPINDFDILDGSIGRRWSDYRKDKSWVEPVGTYVHAYRDQRGERECLAYKWSEKAEFQKWLRTTYIPHHLPQYLITKYGKSATRLIYNDNGMINDEILQLTEVKRKAPTDEKLLNQFLASRQKLLGY